MGKKVFNIPQHSVAVGSITSAVTWVNVPDPVTSYNFTENALRQPLFCNYTNGYVEFSIDGGNSIAMTLAPGMAFVDDATSNSRPTMHKEDGPLIGNRVEIMVRRSSLFTWPASPEGAVIVSGFYEQGD